ncbi:MAG: hypothetical protein ACREFX_04625 [Opitutaceae bacterium]
MSLNRSEQRIFDYLRGWAEERQHWVRKVQTFSAESGNAAQAAQRLEGELWRYYVERSAVVPALREAAVREGLNRTSLRNLAEMLLRQWTNPKPTPNRTTDLQ